MLTGEPPDGHGIVGNGWLFRDTGEVRFWQQSNALIQAEPLYVTARRRAAEQGRPSGSPSCSGGSTRGRRSISSVTPKPYYGADGNKAFGIDGTPARSADRLEARLGPLPVPHLLGAGGGPALHAVDRPLRGGGSPEVARRSRPGVDDRAPPT